MLQADLMQRVATTPRKVPSSLRFLGTLVLEILPAALASVIGGILLAHYQLGRPATPPQPAVEAPGPASAEMVRLVRDEHAMIRAFLDAQTAAAKSRLAAADAEDVRAKMAAAARVDGPALAAAQIRAPRSQVHVAAAAVRPPLPPPLPVARPNQNGGAPPVEPAARDHASILGTTLAIPSRMIALTLRGVAAVGAIPSWIGRRLDSGEFSSAASPFAPAS